MNLRVHWLVILLALALAWPLRTRAGAGNVVEPGELYGVAALYSDGESCLHARRVACALEGAGVGSRDGLLGHPDPAEIVAPPLYDAARTALVQLRVAPGDELGFQRFLAGLGPWTGVLVCFLAWLAASAAGAGLVESLLVALWIAVAPACVRSSEWGRISDVALGLVPLALAVRFSTRALASEEPLRAILGGLSSGAFAGLLLACSPAGCVPFVAGVAGFALWTWRASGETARFAARAGLLYCLVAALVARMLVLDGPWQAEPGGLFATWVEAASNLAFACGAPFLIAVAREQAAAKRVFPLLVMLAACVVIGLLILRSLAPIGRVWTAWAQARELRPLFGAQDRREILLALTPLCLFLPAGWLALARRRLDPASLYLLVFSAGMLLATLVDPELAPWCVLASALLLARSATGWGTGSPLRRWTLSIAAAVLVAHALAGLLVQPDMALHETRVEIARGLRWMRENTPSPGPWNAPRAQPDWGVLSVPSRGAEIAWEARRPAVFSEAGVYGNLESLLATSRVLRGEEFERALHSCGTRYIVISPLDTDGFDALKFLPQHLGGETRALAGFPYPFYSLGQPGPDSPGPSAPKRVYASTRFVDRKGHAVFGRVTTGPAISIWELPTPKRDDSGPQMTPR